MPISIPGHFRYVIPELVYVLRAPIELWINAEFKVHERSILVRPVQLETSTQEATLLYNVLS